MTVFWYKIRHAYLHVFSEINSVNSISTCIKDQSLFVAWGRRSGNSARLAKETRMEGIHGQKIFQLVLT